MRRTCWLEPLRVMVAMAEALVEREREERCQRGCDREGFIGRNAWNSERDGGPVRAGCT